MIYLQAQRSIDVADMQIKTNRLALKQANEALRIRTNRYKQGLERTADLLTDEATVAEKELMLINAIYDYNVAIDQFTLLNNQDSY